MEGSNLHIYIEKETKEEKKCYKLAQEIDNYNEDKDGCHWGHILEVVERAYKMGKEDVFNKLKKVMRTRFNMKDKYIQELLELLR